jgi:hypothetical protein
MLARLMPTIVVTTGTVILFMAFLSFGKRRRDEEPTGTDEQLCAAAASGTDWIPTGFGDQVLVPDAAAVAAAVRAAAVSVTAPVLDADLPRWRRPSLIDARRKDPVRSTSTAVALTFAGAAGQAVEGLDRLRVRYRLVGLLSEPDEVTGVEIGLLDQGDEVVLLGRHGAYRHVLCPDGRQGWLHKMTLSEIEAPPPAVEQGDDEPALGSFESALLAAQAQRGLS